MSRYSICRGRQIVLIFLSSLSVASLGCAAVPGSNDAEAARLCREVPDDSADRWLTDGFNRQKAACNEVLGDAGSRGEFNYYLGRLYFLYGDSKLAEKYFRVGSDSESLKSKTALGWMVWHQRQDHEAARALWTASAEMGDPVAQTLLAMVNLNAMFRGVEDVPRDRGKALSLLRQAADAGYPVASYILGSELLAQNGADEGVALQYLAAAEKGGVYAAHEALERRGLEASNNLEWAYPSLGDISLVMKRP